jgi:hypothetical protein
MRLLIAFACAVAFVLFSAAAGTGAPPENGDPRLAPWFESLRQPGTGISCCSIADCRPVDYRVGENGYEVLIEDLWRPVPADKVLQGKDNPLGRAVVCWTPVRGIVCFVRGTEI